MVALSDILHDHKVDHSTGVRAVKHIVALSILKLNLSQLEWTSSRLYYRKSDLDKVFLVGVCLAHLLDVSEMSLPALLSSWGVAVLILTHAKAKEGSDTRVF